MKKLFFFLLLLNSHSLWSQEKIQEIPIDLDTFIKGAKENDPQLGTVIAERLRAKYLLDLNLPTRQILLSVQNEYGFTRNEDKTAVLGATLTKPLLESGTTLSVGKTLTDRPDRTEDLTQFRIEQSLYRNAFGSQTRDIMKNLDLQKSVVELQVVEAYEDYIERVIHQYLDLTLTYLSFQASQRLHKESQLLLKSVNDRKAKNVASNTDVKRAKLQTALRQEDELQTKANLESISLGIARIIGNNKTEILIPQTQLIMEDRLNNIDQNIESFLSTSRSRIIYDKQVLVADANIEIARENQKPTANLLAGFNIDKSSRFGTSINREEAVIGINIDIPFDDSLTKARIKEASYLLLKSKLAKKSFDNAIKESLYVIRNKILRQREQLQISKDKRDLAAQIVQEETKRYKVGRITLENLIQDKNIEAQYEFAYLAELTNLNKLIVQWLGLTDKLVESLPVDIAVTNR